MHARRRIAAVAIAAAAVLPLFTAAPAFAASPACTQTAGTVTCVFKWTALEQHFTVPAGVTSIDVVAIGGKGATPPSNYSGTAGSGGHGAVVAGTLAVTPGLTLYLEVGGNGASVLGGSNGGGAGTSYSADTSGGGGGASDVRTTACGSPCVPDLSSLDSRLLIAGGGGGGGAAFNVNGGNGGSAGSTVADGSDGTDAPTFSGSGGQGGGGADSDIGGGAGGAGGTCTINGAAGNYGEFANGGESQQQTNTHEPGGGGGGGYWGGGAGGNGAYCLGDIAGGGGGGAGSSWVDPVVTSSSIGTDATGVPSITVSYAASDQPDGLIRKKYEPFAGDNVYNSDGTNQTSVASAVVGSWTVFRIAVQNDGNGPDQYTFHATGSAAPGYKIVYYRKSHAITSAVVAGTFTTPKIPVGEHYVIEAWVKVKAAAGASAARLVTITSVGDGSTVDAVGFQVNRN